MTPAAFAEELLSHYRDLCRHLTFRLRNPDDAADIAQSSFEQVYAHALKLPTRGREIESPRALLFRVAHNLCIDQARHRKIVQAWEEERGALYGSVAAPSSEHLAAHRQLVERVAAHLELLPPRRREVFLLFRAYGYSQAEIAQRLSITEAAVAKHVLRATLDCAKVFGALRAEFSSLHEPVPVGASVLPAGDGAC